MSRTQHQNVSAIGYPEIVDWVNASNGDVVSKPVYTTHHYQSSSDLNQPRTRSGSSSQVSPQPLKRFLFRALTSISISLALTIYYTLTYVRWLRYSEEQGGNWIKQGYLDDAEFVQYSWFVLGAFALNLGTYALGGSLSSMVMTKQWDPKNARRLLHLAANSFADISKWLEVPIVMIRKRSVREGNNGRLWNFFVIINIVGFVAWPITGLTMQTVDGFALDIKNGGFNGANIIGKNLTTFFAQNYLYTQESVKSRLMGSVAPELPRGQFYTELGATVQHNLTSANKLPDDATNTIFLTAQGEGPLVGRRLFGLAVRYNCSRVDSVQNFTILNQREETRAYPRDAYIYPVGNNATGSSILVIRNQFDETFYARTLGGVYMEIGTDIPYTNLTKNEPTNSQHSYIGGNNNPVYTAPGLDNPIIFEVALWQGLNPDPVQNFNEADRLSAQNITIGIPEFEGIYEDSRNYSLKAVGCRCIASSDVGYADVDGTKGTFSGFELVDKAPVQLDRTVFRQIDNPKRFEVAILDFLVPLTQPQNIIPADDNGFFEERLIPTNDGSGGFFSFKLYELAWFVNLFRPTSLIQRYGAVTNRGLQAKSVIQGDDLRDIMLTMYKTYALGLMYDGASASDHIGWFHPNITVARRAKVLVPGVVPSVVVLTMLIVWSFSIVGLAVIYQFRRRLTDKLDTFNAFKFGVARPNGIRPQNLEGELSRSALEQLPGRVSAFGLVDVSSQTQGFRNEQFR